MSRLATLFIKCRVPLFFALWYALNVAYNITNKWALENVHDYVTENTSHSSALPFTIGCLQFGIGAIYACTLWALGWRRPVPHAEELLRAASTFTKCVRNACRKIMRKSRVQLPSRYYEPMTSPNGAPPHNNKEYTPTTTMKKHSESISPSPTPIDICQTFHIAVHHTFGQLCTVISLSANSISFSHVVKAMEPLFSAIATRLVLGQKMNIRVYLSLIPVVGGVIMACAGSNEFSWISFLAGMGANAFFAMRAVVSKIAMAGSTTIKSRSSPAKRDSFSEMNNEESIANDIDMELNSEIEKEHQHTHSAMSPANLFAAVTCMSFCLSIPIALAFEGGILMEISKLFDKAYAEKENNIHRKILVNIISSGLFHYLNNEVMYMVLSNVHPITLAVANTMKRVFIIVAGVLVFSTPITTQSVVGSTIGIGGVFLYSMMKQSYGSGPNETASLCVKGQ